MGTQTNFITENSPVLEAAASARTSETVEYITDLLSELETIATVSGLTLLSRDIHTVVAKHRLVSGKA